MRLDKKTAEPRDTFVFEQGIDFISNLPAPRNLDKALITPFDIFICALGFEQRCVAIPKAMFDQRQKSESELKFARGLIGRYRTNVDDNGVNESTLTDLITSLCDEKQFVDADCPESVRGRLIDLIGILQRKSSSIKVCFDISACSGNFILTVIGVLLEIKFPIELSIVYCQAKQYFPTYMQVKTDRDGMVKKGAMLGESDCYSERGTQEPITHPLYPGFQHEGRPDFVIAIPSFRMNRIVRCINAISEQAIAAPESNVHWVFGQPNHDSDLWRNDFQKEIVVAVLDQLGSNTINGGMTFSHTNSSNCCVFDYRNALKLLLSLADQHLGENITCIPMGSKMQSVGVALALGVRSEISITYARPTAFTPNSYSEEIGSMWELSLGNISDILNLLIQVGNLSVSTSYGTVESLTT